MISKTRSRDIFSYIPTSINKENIPEDVQPTTTYIKNNWIIAEGTALDLYKFSPDAKKDGITYPSVQITSKQNWTTKRMKHNTELYDLVQDIKMGKAIAVSDGSYGPVTKICSAAWTIESETGDQWMTSI